MIRSLLFFGLLASAVGIPIAASNSGDMRERLNQLWNREPVTAETGSDEARAIIAGWNGPGSAAAGFAAPAFAVPASTSGATANGQPVPRPTLTDLGQLLRFDVSPEWVRANWAQNSTALGGPGNYAIRVPVITGTAIDDVAGAVTYYFDDQRHVSRIFLNGRTGDPRKLIAMARSSFQMQPQSPRTQGEQLFQYRWNDAPVGELAIRPVDHFSHENPRANYRIELDLYSSGQTGAANPRGSLFGSRPSVFQTR